MLGKKLRRRGIFLFARKIFLLKFLLMGACLVLAEKVSSEVNILKPDFVDEVVKVTSFGNVVFKNHGEIRLWGLITEPTKLRKHLIHGRYACFSLEKSKVIFAKQKEVNAAICTNIDPISGQAKSMFSLYSKLFAVNSAREYCQETKNYFGSCSE